MLPTHPCLPGLGVLQGGGTGLLEEILAVQRPCAWPRKGKLLISPGDLFCWSIDMARQPRGTKPGVPPARRGHSCKAGEGLAATWSPLGPWSLGGLLGSRQVHVWSEGRGKRRGHQLETRVPVCKHATDTCVHACSLAQCLQETLSSGRAPPRSRCGPASLFSRGPRD